MPHRKGTTYRVVEELLALRERLADWEVGFDDLIVQKDKCIGTGSTSMVYLGSVRDVPGIVAIKECSISEVEDLYGSNRQVIAIIRELEVWPEIDHPNILKFLGFGFNEDATTLRTISQFCSGGTLFDLLHNCWTVKLSNTQKMTIMRELASAVAYLHCFTTPVIHRDLKSLNVLMAEPVESESSPVKALLADFGFARISKGNQGWSDLTSGVGTPHWMAPEVSQGTQYHTQADVFSFAVIMYEVVCRHMFFADVDPEEVQSLVSRGQRPELYGEFESETYVPADTPDRLRQLMARCWSQAAHERPTMQEVVEELARIDWPDT